MVYMKINSSQEECGGGDKNIIAAERDAQILHRLWNSLVPPAMLESDGVAELRIENDKVAGN